MSLNVLKSSFLEQIEASLGFYLPEKYNIILKAFGESYVVYGKSMDALLKLHEVNLEKLNEAIQETGYIIRKEIREGTYYMDYVKPRASKLSDVNSQIAQLLIIATDSGHPAFKEINFSHLTIGGEKFDSIEFVKKVQKIVAILISNNNTVIIPEVAAPEVAAPEVAAPEVAAPEVAAPEVADYILPKAFDSLSPGSEKLWKLYQANEGVVFTKSEISRLTGLSQERIPGTHGNLKMRFSLPTGMIIQSVAREAFVYCEETDVDRIVQEYKNKKTGESTLMTNIGIKERQGVVSDKGEIQQLDSYLSLFKQETDAYKLYEFYFKAGGQKIKLSQVKDAGISLANPTVSLKSVNERLEKNKTGQIIVSVEGERGTYKLITTNRNHDREQSPQGLDLESSKNIVGEKFQILENRLQTIVEGNRKIFNRERLSAKGIELSIDQFIFCLLCWENQEVGIDEQGIKNSLIDGTDMSWLDILQFKSSIGGKFSDVRLEFFIPVKGFIILREKNQADFGRRFLEFMESQKGRIVSKKELYDVLVGIGTDENLISAFYQARNSIPKNQKDTLHKLGGKNDRIEFYYGDFVALQKLQRQTEDTNIPLSTATIGSGEQTETKKPIELILSKQEQSIIQGMDLSFEIDFVYGGVDGIELGEVYFNIFILCVLHRGKKIRLGDMFRKLASRQPVKNEIDRIREAKNKINEKFGVQKHHLFLQSKLGTDDIWFGKLEEEKKVTTISTVKIPTEVKPSSLISGQQTPLEKDSGEVKVMKGGIVFTWDKESGMVSYANEIFDLNEIDKEIRGYIERLFKNDRDIFNISFKGKNPENEKHRLIKILKELKLPFSCGDVSNSLLPFFAKRV